MTFKKRGVIDGPQPDEALRRLMTSEEDQPSAGDKFAAELQVEIAALKEARPDIFERRTPGGISKRAAAVRAELAKVDAKLEEDLAMALEPEPFEGLDPAIREFVSVVIRDPKHRQDFNKAARNLWTEALKTRKYPYECQRMALAVAAGAFEHARDAMRACGDELTRKTR